MPTRPRVELNVRGINFSSFPVPPKTKQSRRARCAFACVRRVCETNPPAHRYSNFVNNVVQIQPARPPYAIITKRNKPQQRLGKINCINFFLCRESQALAGFSRQAWVGACGCNSDFPSTGEKKPRHTTGQMKIYGEPYCIFYVPVGRWRVSFFFFVFLLSYSHTFCLLTANF